MANFQVKQQEAVNYINTGYSAPQLSNSNNVSYSNHELAPTYSSAQGLMQMYPAMPAPHYNQPFLSSQIHSGYTYPTPQFSYTNQHPMIPVYPHYSNYSMSMQQPSYNYTNTSYPHSMPMPNQAYGFQPVPNNNLFNRGNSGFGMKKKNKPLRPPFL